MKSTDPNFIQAQKDGEKWMKEHPDVPVVDVDTGERRLAKDWNQPPEPVKESELLHSCKNCLRCGHSIFVASSGELSGSYIHVTTGNWTCPND